MIIGDASGKEMMRAADAYMQENHPSELHKMPPRVVPVPTLDSPNIRGPLNVSPEYREEFYRNKEAEKSRKEKERMEKEEKDRLNAIKLEESQRQKAEFKYMNMITKRDRLRLKLENLNPRKKKNARKIAEIKAELLRLDRKIEEAQTDGSIIITGKKRSRFRRFWENVKLKARKKWKKVKRFFRKHKETIIEIASIIVPVLLGKIGYTFFKRVLRI